MDSKVPTWIQALTCNARMGLLNESDSGFINNNISTRQSSVGVSSLPVFQSELAIVVLDNPVALAGGGAGRNDRHNPLAGQFFHE